MLRASALDASATSGITPPSQAPALDAPPSQAPAAASQAPATETEKWTYSSERGQDPPPAAQAPAGANLRQRLNTFVDTTLPNVKAKIKRDNLHVVDSFGPRENTQSADDAELQKAKEMKEKKLMKK